MAPPRTRTTLYVLNDHFDHFGSYDHLRFAWADDVKEQAENRSPLIPPWVTPEQFAYRMIDFLPGEIESVDLDEHNEFWACVEMSVKLRDCSDWEPFFRFYRPEIEREYGPPDSWRYV